MSLESALAPTSSRQADCSDWHLEDLKRTETQAMQSLMCTATVSNTDNELTPAADACWTDPVWDTQMQFTIECKVSVQFNSVNII